MSDSPFSNDIHTQWCPGCPNHSILKSVRVALASLELKPEEVCLVSGIGQAAKLPQYVNTNFFNGLHGRALPVATGVKAANPGLTTLVTSGDGDIYGEGGNHFLHALRRNPDITVVVHDNELYALTKGQASPTTPLGEVRSLQLNGADETPLNPLATALVHGCGYVARGFAAEPEQLAALIRGGIEHPGFSLIEVVQPCITWSKHPITWYRDRVTDLTESYDPTDLAAAIAKSLETEQLPIGLIYRGNAPQGFAQRREYLLGKTPAYDLPPVGRDKLEGFLERFKVEV